MLFSRAGLALALTAASPAMAQVAPPADATAAARAAFERGSLLYAQARYEEAVASFEAARRAKPLPAFDFNIARCHERLGQWREAVVAYERYVAAAPNAEDVDQIRFRLIELRQRLGPPPKAEAAPPAAGEAATAAAAVPAARRAHVSRVAIGGIVVGVVGLGLIGGGVGLGLASNATAARLEQQIVFEPEVESTFKAQRTLELASLAIGGAAVGTAVVLIAAGQARLARARSR